MATDNLSASLTKLSLSTKQLNRLTDQVNNALGTTERLLLSYNVGIETWIPTVSTYSIGLYNYGGKEWRLCVLEQEPTFDGPSSGSISPWENCSRDEKLMIAEHLPALIEALQRAVDTRIKGTNEAILKIARLAIPLDAE
jgi:hypothetical protein